MEDEILASDGEEDLEFVLNEASENPITASSTFRGSSDGSGNDCTPDIEGIVEGLPAELTVTVTAKPGDDSYFTLTIGDDTGIPAWCADQDLGLENGETTTFQVFSSYEDITHGEFENAQNFDKVNWMLNQDFIGAESATGLGEYTYGHVQYAIWLLVDDSVCVECTYMTDPTGNWMADKNDVALATELADLALEQGVDFVPGCGELIAIVLASEVKQSIIITKEVPPLVEECSDCEGKVTELELEWDWHRSKYVKMYQRIGNTCYGTRIFSDKLEPGEKFTINGTNSDGTFGRYVYIYIKNRYGRYCYYTKIKTNCDVNIGPGYTKGVFNVISGMSSDGGELCEYEVPDNHCNRHWSCSGHNSCQY